MTVLNDLDRFHLVLDVIARVPGLAASGNGKRLESHCHEMLARHQAYIRQHGDDMPAIREWRWPRS